MKTTFREEDGKYIVTLEGRLDTVSSEQTAKELSVLNDCTGHDIIIDCEKLEYISSSGLRILLGIRKNASAVGSKVKILNLSDDIRKVFNMTGFSALFDI
ncbi:MAG: STAS domain-containing protein [Prevotella sp.]|jgi:anti-anti-sigma factor|nr:STAS domain-containing protein [Prevotella sp.]MBQ2193324.1 STAS domain-containing protein [Prevotella sp.]